MVTTLCTMTNLLYVKLGLCQRHNPGGIADLYPKQLPKFDLTTGA